MPAAFLINGEAPADLGVRLARRELQSMDISRVVLEVVDEDIFSPELFAYGTAVTITGDYGVWFRGTVYKTSLARDGSTMGQQIEIRDAWQALKDTPAEQDPDPDNPDTHDTVVGLGGSVNEDIVNGATAADDTARFAGQADPGLLTVGDISNTMPGVPRTLNNPSLADALTDTARTSPGQVTWFDYGTSPPTLHSRVIDSSSPVITLDVADGKIARARIAALDHLLVGEVTVNFVDYSSGVASVVSTQHAINGALPHARKLVLTHSLPGTTSVWGTDGDPSIDPTTGLAVAPTPNGYAEAILASYGHEFFEGEIVLKDDDVGGTLYMGRALAIAGGPDRWATMRAPIIAVSEDILAGETTLTIGPNRRADGPKSHRPSAPAAAEVTPSDPGTAEEPAHDPLETYVAVGTNIIKVAPGLCGLDEDANDVEVDGTAPDTVATIGLGGSVDVYLGVSFTPDVEEVTVIDDDGTGSSEYRPVGTAVVLTATIQTNKVTPAPQPAIVNYSTGAVTQNGVFYFLLGQVTWPGGTAPTVQVIRSGNFDLINIPPNRCYLRVNA